MPSITTFLIKTSEHQHHPHPKDNNKLLEIKPCGGALVLEFEMWRHFDTKQKSFTLFDCVWLYGLPWPYFLIFKTKKTSSFFFWDRRLIFFWILCYQQDIFNKLIEINFCLGCMVWPWLRLLHHWSFVKYWWDGGYMQYFQKICLTLRNSLIH